MHEDIRDVVVTYAGGRRGPWKHDYAGSTPLSTVRTDAMGHFGIADSAEGGNQVIFRLYHGGDRIENLSQSVDEVGAGRGAVALRLVREVIAG